MTSPTPQRLLKTSQLFDWLGVRDTWLRDRRKNDPAFPVLNLARDSSDRATPRYDPQAIAAHLGIPLDLDPETGLPQPLMTTEQIYAWLNVSEMWLIGRMEDPNFPVLNVGLSTEKRTLRFQGAAVAAYLGIPAPRSEQHAAA